MNAAEGMIILYWIEAKAVSAEIAGMKVANKECEKQGIPYKYKEEDFNDKATSLNHLMECVRNQVDWL